MSDDVTRATIQTLDLPAKLSTGHITLVCMSFERCGCPYRECRPYWSEDQCLHSVVTQGYLEVHSPTVAAPCLEVCEPQTPLNMCKPTGVMQAACSLGRKEISELKRKKLKEEERLLK